MNPPPPSAHLYLAQLSEGDPHTALNHYQSAIDIFNIKLKAKGKGRAVAESEEDPEEDADLRNSIVRALVGMVEIWMDPSYDLWYGTFIP